MMAAQAPAAAPTSAPAPPAALPKPVASPIPVTAKPVEVVVKDMPPEDHGVELLNIGVTAGVGLAAAIIGAVVGYALTKRSNDTAREREEREKNAHASFVMIQKIGKIYSRLTVINEIFEKAAIKTHEDGQPHIFINARGAANALPEVHFTPDDLWRTGRMADLSYINAVTMLDDQFNSLLSMTERYDAERERVMERLIPHCPPNEVGFDIDWNHPEIAKELPRFNALDEVIASIIETTDEDRKVARKAIIDLHKGTGRYLKRQNRIVVKSLDGEPEDILALDEGSLEVKRGWARLLKR